MAKRKKSCNCDHRGRNDSDDFMGGIIEVEKVAIGGAIVVGTMGMMGAMMGGNK